MKPTTGLTSLALALTAHASAQTTLYAFRATGDLLKIDPATGAATPIGSSGIPCGGAGSETPCLGIYCTSREDIPITGSSPPQAGQLYYVNRWTGAIWQSGTTTGFPAGSTVHGFDGMANVRSSDPTASDVLYSIDSSNAWQAVGPTGRRDIESLVYFSASTAYALGTDDGGSLYTINTSTGAATLIGGGGFGDARALALMPGGTFYACGSNLLSVNPQTGATTIIGPTGYSDIRALATVTRDPCYANCDKGQVPPWLNVLDFQCFLNRFAVGDPWANCDQSTSAPTLNVNDFMCFLNAFAAGCT
jgi:hypothetical protein